MASSAAAAIGPAVQGAPRVEVRVDPRVELVTIAARLAGFDEYNRANAASPYSADVDRHFGALREHPAIATLKRLRAERGVSYDALPSFAVHVEPLPSLAERVPFDARPERLDARWGIEPGRRFLAELRDFAADSEAAEFFERHAPLYAETERRLADRLSQSRALPWFDAFFGARPSALYVAIPGLVCGGNNFGTGIRFPDARPEEITPVFGCSEWDPEGVPVFGDGYLPLFIHELCHSYTNPIVDRFATELADAGARIHATCRAAMERQAYGTWQTMMYESLVRACVVRCRLATEGEAAAREQARYETAQRFTWVPRLAALLGDYESEREKYPAFDAFMPRVIAFFDSFADEVEAAEAKRPHVVSTEPANGATEVDPALTKLAIRFDRAMLDQSWSIVGGKADTPEITGKLAYDAERRVLTVPVRLQSGRSYRFWLNSESKHGFQSADGVPLEPFEVAFATR
jgi:hypothetical protein